MPDISERLSPFSNPVQDAEEYIRAFREHYAKNREDKTKIQQFFLSNPEKLNSTLLEVLPSVFANFIENYPPEKRVAIANLFRNFGNQLREFQKGDHALNLELCLVVYNLSLKIYTREDFPEEWAKTLNHLGIAYKYRIKGEQAENLERAIELYEQALQVYTCQAFPEEWAMMMNNLASAYRNRIQGERADNLERSIELCQEALDKKNRHEIPEKWAKTINNLANTYSDRIKGDRAENLEMAIELYNQALEACDCEKHPKQWAITISNLANSYLERIKGDRAENLERAIDFCSQALQVYTRENSPEQWAMTINNLAIAYRKRIKGDRAENLELAIEFYRKVLQIYTSESYPDRWAKTLNNLAIAYFDRIQGDRSENLEQAIELHQKALEIFIRESYPEKWAGILNNLGIVYSDRIQGNRIENLKLAIDFLRQALQVYTRQNFPEKWATSQGHLAGVLIKQAELTDRPTDLDTAIALLQEALEVSPAGCPDFIDSQYRLGTALSKRYDRNKNFDDLRQALVAYKIALDLISPEHYDRKQIWKALPTTQTILGSRLVRDGQWQEGLQLLVNSVNQLSTGDDCLAHANALYHTGRAHEALSEREKARVYYRDALRLYEHLQDLPGIAKSRTGLGNVLISLGHLEKGIAELDRAGEIYRKLNQPDKEDEIDTIYQAALRAIERQTAEVTV